MASVKFLLQSKSNNAPIYLRLSIGRGQVYKRKTGLSINPKEWNIAKGLPKQTTATNKNLSTELQELQTHIFKQLNEANSDGKVITSDWLEYQMNLYFGRVTKNEVSDFVLDVIQNIIDTAHIRPNAKGEMGLSKTRKNSFETLKTSFKNFQGKRRFRISDVDVSLANDFLQYLLETCKYAQSTAAKRVSDLKTVCFEAESLGLKVSPQLRKIKSRKYNNNFIVYLTPNDLIKIKKAEISSPSLQNARKWLLLGCYIGQRGGDLLNLTQNNFVNRNGLEVIEFTQQKTRKHITIPVLPETREIIASGLPYKISLTKLNEYVKDVCKIAKINEITKGSLMDPESKRKKPGFYEKWKLISSHTFRRTFISNYYGKVRTGLLMGMTGQGTEKILLNYIGKDGLDFAQEMADLLELQKLKTLKETNSSDLKNQADKKNNNSAT